mgnify:CR=1 FL=1|jgi:hypothetical protein
MKIGMMNKSLRLVLSKLKNSVYAANDIGAKSFGNNG